MTSKEQKAQAHMQILVQHQKAVFTSNPCFDKIVSEAFERIKPSQDQPAHEANSDGAVNWSFHPELKLNASVFGPLLNKMVSMKGFWARQAVSGPPSTQNNVKCCSKLELLP